MVVRANADVTPRGVVYTLRSVLRGLAMSSLAHFTGVLYSPAWVFTLSVYHHRFPKTSNSEQAEVKHPRFSFVVNRKCYLFAWVKTDSYKRTY